MRVLLSLAGCALVVVLGIATSTAAPAEAPASPAALEQFEKEIRPLLARECMNCHGAASQQGGLRLDSRQGVLKGGQAGPAVNLQRPPASLLLKAVRHEGLVMPPSRRLPDRDVAALEKWIAGGLPYPAPRSVSSAPDAWPDALQARRNWWSLQPVRRTPPPAVKNKQWSQDPIDLYLLAALEKKGLKPALRADRRTLIRRAYLLLTGLPPAPEAVESFTADADPRAYEKLIDRLLASPQFGERWARHWMDVVRYGENHGYEWNYEVRDAWRYRDYLIRAFNQDVPYDQLVREHIAGDVLPSPRLNPAEKLNESVIGTAAFRFGEAGHDVFKEIGLDYLDGQIDTLSKAFQAATVTCARCHDHKLDAVSMKDYYALLGILASSRLVVHTLDSPEAFAPAIGALREIKQRVRGQVAEAWRQDAREVARYLLAAQASAEGNPAAPGLDTARLNAWSAALKAGSSLEDPLHPWNALKGAASVPDAWTGLARRYDEEAKARAEFNRRFTVLGDFTDGTNDGWRVSGAGLAPVQAGELVVSLEGETVVQAILPAGLATHAYSNRLNGSLISPDLPQDTRTIHYEVYGGKQAATRVVPDFRHLGDAGQEIKSETPVWMRQGRSERDEYVSVEIVTKGDNQRFPERAARAKQTSLDDARSYFGVSRVLVGPGGEAPRPELNHVLPLFAASTPATREEAAAKYEALVQSAVDAWAAGSPTDAQARLVGWLLSKNLLRNSLQALGPSAAEAVREYRRVETTLPTPRIIAGLGDQGKGFDHPLYNRGDFRSPGEAVARRYLEVLSSDRPFTPAGSGRLELAERIADPRNPLTGRVFVNRVWHWLFGKGIVTSVDDFGHMGEIPSHPQLIDYLAATFTAPSPQGMNWSLKRLVRRLALTQAFQMSSQAAESAMQVDPDNVLLHHFGARRVEAEIIRDSILAVSGRLDPEMYGPSIHPYRFQEKADRKLLSGALDGEGRRSVYTRITLMEGPPFLGVFNQPEAKVPQGKRDVTNVPAQALALLNDPFLHQQSGVWAEKLIAGSEASPDERIGAMFLRALGRRPSQREAERFRRAVQDLAQIHQCTPDGVMKHRELWKDLAHAVFNMKEFIYVR